MPPLQGHVDPDQSPKESWPTAKPRKKNCENKEQHRETLRNQIAKPEETTAKPEETTTKPEETRAKPETNTAKPEKALPNQKKHSKTI